MTIRWLLLVLLLAVVPSGAAAQRTRLSVTGFSVVFPAPTAADFAAGYIESPTITTFTVNAQTGAPTNRTATVSMRCRTPCPTTGSKPLGTLQWRRVDQSTWHTLTTTNATVESRPMRRNGLNDPWSNSIVWRFLLDWDADPPGAVTTFNIVFTLVVTTP